MLLHLAGTVRGARQADFDRVNVAGAVAVAHAAARAGVVRALLVSSLAAREPALSFYARSKRGGEEAFRAVLGRVTVLRPPAVYGPGDRELWPLIDGMRRGRGVHPAHRGRFSLIHVDDVAGAILAWLGAATAGGTYEIDDGADDGHDWPEVLAVVARVASRRVVPLPVPRALLTTVGAANQAAARLLGYAPMVTPGKVRELYHSDWVCRDRTFSAATGWSPRYDLEAGLRATFAAYDA